MFPPLHDRIHVTIVLRFPEIGYFMKRRITEDFESGLKQIYKKVG